MTDITKGTWRSGRDCILIDQFPIIEALIEDVRRGVPAGKIAARFHNGVIRILSEAAGIAARRTGINRVALSGGVFQNAYLSERLERDLSRMGLEVYSHMEVPGQRCVHFPWPGVDWRPQDHGRVDPLLKNTVFYPFPYLFSRDMQP